MVQPSDIAEFVEAARKGNVVKFIRLMPASNSFVLSKHKPSGCYAIPAFDFGYTCDPTDPNYTGDSFTGSFTDAAWGVGLELLKRGEFQLPYPECLYLFRFHETRTKYATLNLIRLVQDGNEITGEVYFRQATAPKSEMRLWTKDVHQFTFVNGTDGVEIAFDPAVLMDSVAEREKYEDCKAAYTHVVVATILLNNPKHTFEVARPSDFTQSVNAGRTRAGLLPLPDLRVVHWDKEAAIRYVDETRGPASRNSPRPHDRRGHYRTLKSGKRVPVSPAKIKGGSEVPPNYDVSP
ncbi:hypothetical protein [Azospirillum sp. TSH64]|uniref:hypothetical protein n=1 Tax=Azospirillum sp. TSH64 TaxID=652740 RepID=UPI0011B22F70|nr:hypothetical protein [Azospirillum sp. TSH64]